MTWLSRIFGSPKKELSCLDIVSEYGTILEQSQLGWSGVHDIRDLPFEKSIIKSAIFEAAEQLRDSPEQINMLGSGLVLLGTFQPQPDGLMQMPQAAELEAMNQDDFKAHIKAMMSRRTGDTSAANAAKQESEALLVEWNAYLSSLGISNA